MNPVQRTPVSVLGATGVVGQRFVARLAAHPWFEIAHVAASDRSLGKRYGDACTWRVPNSVAFAGQAERELVACTPQAAMAPVVFSALDTGPAREIEPEFARAGAVVFSNASAFRMERDVPLLVPEVNPEHLALIETQRSGRGWRGAIVCNPNCTATVLVMALGALHGAFGIEQVLVTSMQAASGAGYPGVASLDILGNVIPYIANEEQKLEEETRKMLGRFANGAITDAPCTVSASCNRVAVLDGHTLSVSLKLRGNPKPDIVREVLAAWRGEPQRLNLPSAPAVPLRMHDEQTRPQPRLDVDLDGGMPVHIGRVRECPVLGIKLTLLGNNVERGAAGASVLNAELARAKGLV